MKLIFPDHFIFGTSTSAYQIETAFDHDWKGIKSQDGNLFHQTTDHELRYREDIEIISSLAPAYRMSLMWSKLQRKPYGALDPETTAFYHSLLAGLKEKNVSIMMVLHHFANPVWFAKTGGWMKDKNIAVWYDYACKLIDEFGEYVTIWNTFNEPNLYTTFSFVLGEFPPFKKNMITAVSVIKNIAKGHEMIYDYLKQKFPDKLVGISHNCAVFAGENIPGSVVARLADKWYMEFLPKHFSKSDFTGLSYYTRVSWDPRPISYLHRPEKMNSLKKEHDDIWEYYPQGLRECIDRYWIRNKKPIIITENGICTADDTKRTRAIRDYAKIVHEAIADKIDVLGYYHWSTWDNFEWTLGPTFKFGLYACDPQTMERKKKPSADLYSNLAHNGEIEVD